MQEATKGSITGRLSLTQLPGAPNVDGGKQTPVHKRIHLLLAPGAVTRTAEAAVAAGQCRHWSGPASQAQLDCPQWLVALQPGGGQQKGVIPAKKRGRLPSPQGFACVLPSFLQTSGDEVWFNSHPLLLIANNLFICPKASLRSHLLCGVQYQRKICIKLR